MSASRMRARADLRARPVSIVVLAIVVGVCGGGAIAAFLGAERTETAYDRYRRATDHPDVVILEPGIYSSTGVAFDEAAAMDEVERSTGVDFFLGEAYAADGSNLFFEATPETTVLVPDAGIEPFFKIREGRPPEASDEVSLAWPADQERPAAIGDQVQVVLVAKGFEDELFSGQLADPPPDAFVETTATVVGLHLPDFYTGGGSSDIVAATSFAEARPDAFRVRALALWLDDGADVVAFEHALREIDANTYMVDLRPEAAFAGRSTRFPALVARIVAAFLAITGLLVAGQTMIRRTALGGVDDPILRALGMTRRQVLRGAMIPPALVGAAGGLLAMIVAWVASGWFPIGLARGLEPTPGGQTDPAILVGALMVAATPVVLALPSAWRLATARAGVSGTREFRGAERRSRLGRAIAARRVSMPALVGSRMALEPGHGRTAAPVRSTLVALSLAVIAAVAGLVFAASMTHFTSTPRLWGVDFTFATGFPFGEGVFEEVAVPVLRDDPGLERLSFGNFQRSVAFSGANGRVEEVVWALEAVRGAVVSPTMIEGRWPTSANEVAFGSHTLDELGVGIGDEILASVGTTQIEMTVVGRTVLPDFGFGPGLGDGAGLSMEALRRLYPSASYLELALADYADGVSPQEVIDRLNPTLSSIDAEVSTDDIERLGTSVSDAARYQRFPFYAAMLFVLAALATLAHLLLTSARVRRRDLAVVRTLGFRGRQVMSTVAWQATTLVTLALVIGTPVGLLVGRMAWNLLADRMGVISVPILPLGSVALVVPVLYLAALLVALGPAIAARRTRPAAILRAE